MAVRPRRRLRRKFEALLDTPPIQGKGGSVVEADFNTAYIAAVKAFVDLKLIAQAKQKFAVDVMYGAGRGILAEHLRGTRRRSS